MVVTQSWTFFYGWGLNLLQPVLPHNHHCYEINVPLPFGLLSVDRWLAGSGRPNAFWNEGSIVSFIAKNTFSTKNIQTVVVRSHPALHLSSSSHLHGSSISERFYTQIRLCPPKWFSHSYVTITFTHAREQLRHFHPCVLIYIQPSKKSLHRHSNLINIQFSETANHSTFDFALLAAAPGRRMVLVPQGRILGDVDLHLVQHCELVFWVTHQLVEVHRELHRVVGTVEVRRKQRLIQVLFGVDQGLVELCAGRRKAGEND